MHTFIEGKCKYCGTWLRANNSNMLETCYARGK